MKRKTCNVPGCETRLHSGNVAGVCRAHLHHERYCGCGICGNEIRPQECASGVRRVQKQRLGPGGNEGVLMEISLPIEPWWTDK